MDTNAVKSDVSGAAPTGSREGESAAGTGSTGPLTLPIAAPPTFVIHDLGPKGLGIPALDAMTLVEEQYPVPDATDASLTIVTSVPAFESGPPGETAEKRQLTVSGIALHFDGTNPRLSPLRTLRDVSRVTIVADEVVIAEPLQWFGADVVIVARRLAFRDDDVARPGQLVTTPQPHPAPAFTETRDPESNLPAQKKPDGTLTLLAEGSSGAQGRPGGNVTLSISALDLPAARADGPKRFVCTGGAGQVGETGGHRRKRADGKPVDVTPITLGDIQAAIRNSNNSTGDLPHLDKWSFPAGGQNQEAYGQFRVSNTLDGLVGRGFLAAGAVADCRLTFSFQDFLIVKATHYDVGGRTRNWEKHDWYMPYEKVQPSEWRFPHPPETYGSGRTGPGGKGGSLAAPKALQTAAAAVWDGSGGPSAASPTVQGKAGTPNPYVLMGLQLGQRIGADWKGLAGTVSQHAAEVGPTVDGRSDKPGDPGEQLEQPDTAWLDVRLGRLILAYSRRLAHAGHRAKALTLLQPYVTAWPSAAAGSEGYVDLEQDRCRTDLNGLYTNLASNLDVYGNPGGWVPRFGATSYLDLYTADRAFSYRFCYLMQRAQELVDATDRAAAVLGLVAQQNEAAISQLYVEVAAAYGSYHDALEELQTALSKFHAVEASLNSLLELAKKDAEHEAEVRRWVELGFKVAGAVCVALPVGQPFLAGLGGVLNSVPAAIEKWDPGQGLLDNALGALSTTADGVATCLKDNAATFKDQYGKAIDDRIRTKYADLDSSEVRSLNDKIAVAKDKLADAEKDVDAATGATYRKVAAKSDLSELLRATTLSDAELDLANDREAVKARIAEANADITDLSGAAVQGQGLQRDLAGRQRGNLLAARAKLYAQLADLDASLADARTRASDASAAASDAAAAASRAKAVADKREVVETKRKSLDDLLGDVDQANDKKDAEDSKKAFATALTTAQGVAKGLATSGEQLRLALRPVSEDDQDVQRLFAQELSGPYKEESARARTALAEAKESRARALQMLQKCQGSMTTGISDLSAAISSSIAISRDRQALSTGVSPLVRARISEMSQSAAERMDYYLYLLRKAYLYEELSPVQTGLAQVNDYTSAFDSWLAANRADLAPGDAVAAGGAGVTEVIKRLDALQSLSGKDFQSMGDKVLQETLAEQADTILRHRQVAGGPSDNKGVKISLPRAALALLLDDGVTFDRIADLCDVEVARGWLAHRRVRVSAIKVQGFQAVPVAASTGDSLRLEIEVGPVFPVRGDDARDKTPRYLLFRQADGEALLSYGGVVNRPGGSASTDGSVDYTVVHDEPRDPGDDLYQRMLSKAVGQQVRYQEMEPSFLSPIRFRLVGGRTHLAEITTLTLAVTLSFE